MEKSKQLTDTGKAHIATCCNRLVALGSVVQLLPSMQLLAPLLSNSCADEFGVLVNIPVHQLYNMISLRGQKKKNGKYVNDVLEVSGARLNKPIDRANEAFGRRVPTFSHTGRASGHAGADLRLADCLV